jgi:uncharacterized protein
MISVTGLFRYPVKGLRGHSVPAVDVERCGFAYDRRWMVVDETGRFLTQREYTCMARIGVIIDGDGLILFAAGLPDLFVGRPDPDAPAMTVTVWRNTLDAALAHAEAGTWLSRAIGIRCHLVFLSDEDARPVDPTYGIATDRVSFADGFPVLVTSATSLDDLNARLASPVPIQRFRPNLVVSGADPWGEDMWRRIRVGPVVFRTPKPCTRCIVTSVDQQTGERPIPHEPLRTLARFRRGAGGVIFGQNAVPDTIGRIALGDAVTVLEMGLSPLTEKAPV